MGNNNTLPGSRTLPQGRAMSGFPRVQKHPLLRGGIKGGGRLNRVFNLRLPLGEAGSRRETDGRLKRALTVSCRPDIVPPGYSVACPVSLCGVESGFFRPFRPTFLKADRRATLAMTRVRLCDCLRTEKERSDAKICISLQ